jgi:hypothetical protein
MEIGILLFSVPFIYHFLQIGFKKQVYHFEQSALQTGLNYGATNFL